MVSVSADNSTGATTFGDSPKHFTLLDDNNKPVEIDLIEDASTITVNVTVDDKLDHTAVTNKETGDIILTKASGEKEKSNVKDYLKDNDKKSQKVNKVYNEVLPAIQSIVPAAVSYTDGYYYVEDHFSLDYQISGYLYNKYVGSQGRYMAQRFSFTKGTEVGVVVSVLAAFLTGGVTLGVILIAAGSSIVGGVLGGYVDSSICFEKFRTLYRVRVNGLISLDTYIDDKYEVVHDYIRGTDTYIEAGFGGGFAGSNYDMIEIGCMNYRATYGY
jgi:hypothetical protein